MTNDSIDKELKVTHAPSPNFDDRPERVSMLVLHYTGMQSGKSALQRLRDPAAKVSAHYLIEEDGEVFALVNEEKRAWHAGVSHWAGVEGVNGVSVGIEIVNPGHWWGYKPFPEAQKKSVMEAVKRITWRWDISPANVVGHSDVAPMRKEDPGEEFFWGELAAAGFCIAPYQGGTSKDGDALEYEEALRLLTEIGYGLDGFNHAAPLLAFQRRFIPSELGQGFNPVTRAALVAIAKAHREARQAK